ncbi:unnamed protein product [Nippostrongylus brasiliensis]|uniref:RRM domain-containing protein n=1 Tax=Nippostrongylus brasiliensis TaxID=27835 RepID=A0A0N4YUF2_NIPBR|nr:unnamed protein product [Nippostrongylus brasiliensis]
MFVCSRALIADGHDPATYLFRVNEAASTKPMSPSASPAMETASGDSAKEETSDDPVTTTTAAVVNDEEMLEDPLVEEPSAESAPAPTPSATTTTTSSTATKPSVTVTAQNSVKTPVQAPPSEDKDKDIASRSIWVRGLTSATKAADLKVLCTKYGKVVRAKIFTSKKQSTSACYGYVTMADSASADKAAAAMHKTQIKGRTISVEKVEMFELRGACLAAAELLPRCCCCCWPSSPSQHPR